MPFLAIIGVLLIGGVVVWTQALRPASAAQTGCNAPGVAAATSAKAPTGTASTRAATTTSSSVNTTLGTFTNPQTLAGMRPADPASVPLRVFNASTLTGEAKTVTDELRAAGFTAIGQQANDPLYPESNLRCYGEIRYGYAGQAEARTTLIVAPCAQLVLDGRLDNSVDLSIGQLYQSNPVSKNMLAELTAIKDASAPPPVIEGQTVAIRSLPPIPPLPDRTGCPA